MKYTKEMDVDLSTVPLTNGDILPEHEPLKRGSSPRLCSSGDTSKSHTSNGLNGIKYCAQTLSNGKMTHDSPTDKNIEEIGFEVESYSDFNSPLAPESHSEDRYDFDKVEFVNHGNEYKSAEEPREDYIFESDKSRSDSEFVHDSSHVSEEIEFQLRLSDDDDSNLELAQNRNSKLHHNSIVSSTTVDTTKRCSSIAALPKKDGNSSSGSGTLEGISLKACPQNNQEKNDSNSNLDFNQAKLNERPDSGILDKDAEENHKEHCVTTECCNAKDNRVKTDGLALQCYNVLDEVVQLRECSKDVTDRGTEINKTANDDSNCENTEKKCFSESIDKTVLLSQHPACEENIVKKEETVKKECFEGKDKDLVGQHGDNEKFHPCSGVVEPSISVKSEIKTEIKVEPQIEQQNDTCTIDMKFEVEEESFIKVERAESICGNLETKIKDESVSKFDEGKNDFKDQSSNTEQPPKENYSSLENEIEALENEIDGDDKGLHYSSNAPVIKKAPVNKFSNEETEALRTEKEDENVAVKCTSDNERGQENKIGLISTETPEDHTLDENVALKCTSDLNKSEQESNVALISTKVSKKDHASSGDVLLESNDGSKEEEKEGEEQKSNTQSCIAPKDKISLAQPTESSDDQKASENEECFPSKSTNINDDIMGVDASVEVENSKELLVSCDNLEFVPNVDTEDISEHNSESNCDLASVTHEEGSEKSPDTALKIASVKEDSNDFHIPREESNNNDCLEDDLVCEESDILDTFEADAENLDKSDKDSTDMTDTDQIFNTESNDSSTSLSPTFCDSTVLETSSSDEMESQNCSSRVNESNISKGHNTELPSRKRTLSNSDSDLFDSLKIKKLSSLSESKERQEASNPMFKIHLESSNKRPAEVNVDIDSKKLRVEKERKKDECDHLSNAKDTEDIDRQSEEITRLHRLQKAASVLGVPQDSESFLKLATERAATASASSPPVDLPFLRKLHKKELSKMSRSDLEELVVQKICEAITERSVVGDLRRRCQTLEKGQERDKEKYISLRKQMTELNIVMKKYLDNQKNNVPAPPLKVTRSVGLQVCQGIKPMHPCPVIRTRVPYVDPLSKPSPVAKTASTTPSRQEQSSSYTPQKSSQATSTTPTTPTRTPPVLSPQLRRPVTNMVSSSDPPALVPTSTPTTVLVSMPVCSRQAVTSPRVQVPPLQQISGLRPRFSTPITVASSTSQVVQIHQMQQVVQNRQTSQQNTHSKARGNDVEVIDIVDKDEQNKRSAPGLRISNHQEQHQQKQAANAAAQNLAGNTGMTVRLISPSQVSQPGMTIASGYPHLLVPSQSLPQKMIITSASQGTPIRGNYKLVMKANHIIHGGTATSSVVQIPSSAQAAVQQIFTNASTGNRTNTVATVRQVQSANIHPAPLPCGPANQVSHATWKQLPPRPNLKIQHQNNGIVLSWNMALGPSYADIESYQLYAYQEGTAPPSANLWKKVGDVKALPLPMACTLTQFVEGHRYHFTVRAVDKHGRLGPFSQQGSIRLGN